MKTRIPIICFFLLSSFQVAGQPSKPTLRAFTNITIIDGTGAEPLKGMTVLVQDQQIKDIYKTDAKPVPSGTEIMDFEEHYLLPGLINSHVHLSNILLGRVKNSSYKSQEALLHAELKRMLYGGVTTIRDMAGDARLLAVVKRP